MHARRHNTLFAPAPAALFALAVAMPLAAAGEVSTVNATPERGQAFARCLTQAARQFCGNPAQLPITSPSIIPAHAERPLVALPHEPQVRHGFARLLPAVIDLPPPGR